MYKYECPVCGEIFIRRKVVDVTPPCSKYEIKKLFLQKHPKVAKYAKRMEKTKKIKVV